MRRIAIGLACLAMVGLATWVAVKVASRDGRSPMEMFEAETADDEPEPVTLSSCPSLTPPDGSLPNRNRRQPGAVVPDEAVGILLCEYYGFGTDTPASYDRQEELAREYAKDGPVPAIVGELQNSQRQHGTHGLHCPGDDGARLLAVFSYRGEPPVPVEVDLSGCRSAGAPGRPGVILSKRLLRRLELSLEETRRPGDAP